MLRTIQTVAVAVVIVALGVLLGFVWRDQRVLASRLDELASGLAELAERTDEAATEAAVAAASVRAPESPPPTTVSLTGLVYRGDPSRPAGDFPITLHGANNGFTREMRTRDDGTFASGDLPPDRYFVSLVPENADGETGGRYADFVYTSRNCDLYNGGDSAEVELDVVQLDATVEVRFEPPLSRAIAIDDEVSLGIAGRISLTMHSEVEPIRRMKRTSFVRRGKDYIGGSILHSWISKRLELIQPGPDGRMPKVNYESLEERLAEMPDQHPPVVLAVPSGPIRVNLHMDASFAEFARYSRVVQEKYRGRIAAVLSDQPLLKDDVKVELEVPGPGRYVLEIHGLTEEAIRAPELSEEERANQPRPFGPAETTLAAAGLRQISPDEIEFKVIRME